MGFGLASYCWLSALGANLGLFALLIAYILQVIVDYKIMPKELRPHTSPHSHNRRRHLVRPLPSRAAAPDLHRRQAVGTLSPSLFLLSIRAAAVALRRLLRIEASWRRAGFPPGGST
jgi:hypothetical protein